MGIMHAGSVARRSGPAYVYDYDLPYGHHSTPLRYIDLLIFYVDDGGCRDCPMSLLFYIEC